MNLKVLFNMYDGKELLPDMKLKPTLILVGAAVMVTLHCYFGSFDFARQTVEINRWINPVTYMFITSFILFGVIPAIMLKYVFKESFSQYGVRVGDWKFGLKANLILFPAIFILLLLPAAFNPEMRAFYPFDRSLSTISYAWLQMEFWRVFLYYSAWEFFFRGFMLFGLRKYTGDWMAICIQLIPQCLWHIGMPASEILASIPGGILFGYLALRTGSIFWPFILHCLIGIGMDFLILIT